jgi:hypothetical protein
LPTDRSQRLHATLSTVARSIKSNVVDTLAKKRPTRGLLPSPLGCTTPPSSKGGVVLQNGVLYVLLACLGSNCTNIKGHEDNIYLDELQSKIQSLALELFVTEVDNLYWFATLQFIPLCERTSIAIFHQGYALQNLEQQVPHALRYSRLSEPPSGICIRTTHCLS